MSNDERDGKVEALVDDVRKQVEAYCRESGYRLNPDTKMVERIIKGLARRKATMGEAYCPCRVATGDPEKDRSIICPCVYHKDEIATDGICHCQLFCSEEYAREHQEG